LITGDGEALPGTTFKPSVKIEDAEQRLKELELELAQTKLSLVEAECNVQDLEHRLSSFMSAVAAEESKPWFRRSKLGTPAKK
jgi:predicted nuclease with TOPRIM domain